MSFSIKNIWRNGNSDLSRAYQPIIRGYFGVAAIYYAVITLTHFWDVRDEFLHLMVSVSVAACIVATVCWHALRRPMTSVRLEILACTVNLFVLTNVLVALHIDYQQAKLTYFIMMAMIFPLGSVSMRQALISIVAALAAMFYLLDQRAPEQLTTYSFVAFAAAMSSVSIAFFLRRAIGLAVDARHLADDARQSAEGRLASAEQISEKMRRQSLSDSLTGLPNRRAFFNKLKDSRNQALPDRKDWLILLDLDGFKAVNDNYGHLMGDELLKAVSNRLRTACESNAFVCRMGGDEFNIILSGGADEAEAEAWCNDLLARIAEVYLIEGRLIQISGSIGCYRINESEPDASPIQKADYALMHAKRHGKNRVVLFRKEHAKDAAERFRIEQALRVADFTKEIELLFQPQFDLHQDRIVCAEALARWYSPSIGLIEPKQFIQIAEESGLIARITLAVVQKALAELGAWNHSLPISVNLSGHDLISDQIIDEIISMVEQSRISPALLEFEVTETAMMSDTHRASANLLRLSKRGHPIALDDFGTGYSNFNYLRTLRIGKLKVDRSFMENIADPMAEKILHSLAGMARTLDVHCLIEGIENELELLVAKRVGAQSVQGYLFGRPMNAPELRARIEEQESASTDQPTAAGL